MTARLPLAIAEPIQRMHVAEATPTEKELAGALAVVVEVGKRSPLFLVMLPSGRVVFACGDSPAGYVKGESVRVVLSGWPSAPFRITGRAA